MFCSPYILGTAIALQQKLLAPEFCNLKPDVEFLESFAGVVGPRWPSLAASLGLNHSEIEDVTSEESSHQSRAFHVLRKWCLSDDATYSRLCQVLRTISLFQHTSHTFLPAHDSTPPL